MSNVSYRDFLTQTLNLSPREKVVIAHGALEKIIIYAESLDASKEDIIDLILNLTKLFVSSDVKLVKDEYDFFRAVTDFEVDSNRFYELTNGGADPDFIDHSLEFFSHLPKDVLEAVLTYGMMVMACDDNIDYQESDLIKRIIALF